MNGRIERFGPSGPPITDEDNLSTFELDDGSFLLDVLPTDHAAISIAAAGSALISIELEDAFWYSITVQVNLKNTVAPAHYIYRNQVEVYRDGGNAVLFFAPVSVPVEEPDGSSYTVTLGVTGTDFTVLIANAAAAAAAVKWFVGYTRTPMD